MSFRETQRREKAAFIMAKVKENGRVNRTDLIRAYDYSPANCALIFQRFNRDYPGAIVYDMYAKAYLPGPEYDRHLITLTEEAK